MISRVIAAGSRAPSGGMRYDRSSSSSVSGPEMPNDTTGPNRGSSMLRMLSGTPGGAFLWTTKPAVSESSIRAPRLSQASFISAGRSMLRQT